MEKAWKEALAEFNIEFELKEHKFRAETKTLPYKFPDDFHYTEDGRVAVKPEVVKRKARLV